MRWTTLVALLMLLNPAAADAQGWIEPLPRPRPLPQPAARVERVRTSITVRITDRVARVEVEEWFRNSGGGLAEGDYIYPLAGEAVFSDFSLFQGEEELKGETMDAGRARAIYEDIVRRHRDPALIELTGHGMIRARVFPIAPGETRNVRLRYTQVLGRAGDALRFRHVGGTATPGPDFRPGAPARRPDAAAPLSFTLVAEQGTLFADPFSPTHRLRSSRESGRLVVRPAEELRGTVDLFLPLAKPTVGISLATHRVDGDDGYFMLTLSPGRAEAAAAPRDVAVVVDVSGSMSGEKMEQARQALHRLLGTLTPADRFRLIAFSSGVQAHRPDWTAGTPDTVQDARGWIDRLNATGGTNISGALDEALRTPGGAERLHMVIVITDGQPTAGETDPDRIAARVEGTRRNARIFTFGVGYDLHTYLLERVALAGRGTVEYVQPGADVEDAVGSLAARISHPVLIDLALGATPVRLKDVQPGRLPDLFAGDELVVFGRYESPGRAVTGELAMAGTRSGRQEQFAAALEFPAHAAGGDYIPGLWAARKVGELMRTIRLEGTTPERIAEVRALALRYGLLTEYTSYLVLEPGAAANRIAGWVPPAAPQAVAGQAAVQSAQTAATRRQLQTVGDLAQAESAVMGAIAGRVGSGTRLVAGRQFRQDGAGWVDAAHAATRIVEIAPFSAAYFAVLSRLPELRPYWTAFDAVTVAGGRVSIRLARTGRATLDDQALRALAADFRATAQ